MNLKLLKEKANLQSAICPYGERKIKLKNWRCVSKSRLSLSEEDFVLSKSSETSSGLRGEKIPHLHTDRSDPILAGVRHVPHRPISLTLRLCLPSSLPRLRLRGRSQGKHQLSYSLCVASNPNIHSLTH